MANEEKELQTADTTEANELENKKQQLCLSCQRCCKQVNIVTAYSGDNEEMKKFFATRGFKVYSMAVSKDSKDTRILLIIDIPCAFLTPAGCSIYSNRPQVCRDYDGRLDQFVDCAWKELDNAK